MTKRKIESLEGKIEVVDLAALQVDDTYQREVKRHHRKIAESFHPAAAGVLHVARRSDDSLWIIDGLQRREGMLKAGITKWKALVVYSSGSEYEAKIYRLLNSSETRKGLNPHEMFRACLTAKDPVAMAAKQAVELAGLRMKLYSGGSRGYPELNCPRVLYRETATHGEEVVYRALRLMVETWPGQDECMAYQIPQAMINVIAMHGDKIDDERFVRVLGEVAPRKILLDSQVAFQARETAAMNSIIRIYNKKLTKATRLTIHTEDEGAA